MALSACAGLCVALIVAVPASAARGPPLPPGTATGDYVEIEGVLYQARDGVLYTLDDPALDALAAAVTVTGSRVDPRARALRTEVIDQNALRETGARTLADVLEEQAGVQVNSSLGLGQEVQMDGLDGRHVLILVDGRPVNGRVNNRVDVSRIPVSPDQIERIEVVRGPMSALHGSEALGGVINIITKRPEPVPTASAELGGQVLAGGVLWGSAGLHGSAPAGPLLLRFDVMAQTLPELDRGGRDDDGAVTRVPDGKADLPDRRQLSVGAEALLPLFDAWTLSTGLQGSSSQSSARVSPDAPFRDLADNNEWALTSTLQGDVLDHSELSVDLRVSRFQHRFAKLPRGQSDDPPAFCLDDGDLGVDPPCPAATAVRTLAVRRESRLEARFSSDWAPSLGVLDGLAPHALTTAVGAVVAAERVNRENDVGDDTIPGGGERLTAGLYGELLWQPWSFLTVVPGARFDAFGPDAPTITGDVRDFIALGPKLSTRLDIVRGVAVRASVGQGFRLPSFEERFLRFDHSELGYIVEGQPLLLPEVNRGARAELLFEPTKTVSFGSEGFVNALDNLIGEVAAGRDENGVPVFTYQNVARALTAGLNTRVRAGTGNQAWGALSFDVTHQWLVLASDLSACPEENPWLCGVDEGARSLPLRPEHSVDANLRYTAPGTGTVVFARVDALGARVLDAQGVSTPPSLVLSCGVRQPLFDHAELIVGLENLTDAYDPIFGPKPGRHASVLLRVY